MGPESRWALFLISMLFLFPITIVGGSMLYHANEYLLSVIVWIGGTILMAVAVFVIPPDEF